MKPARCKYCGKQLKYLSGMDLWARNSDQVWVICEDCLQKLASKGRRTRTYFFRNKWTIN